MLPERTNLLAVAALLLLAGEGSFLVNRSDAPRVWLPDVLVQLELHANLDLGIEKPLGEFQRRYPFEHRTQDHDEPAVEAVAADRLNRPVEVLPGRKDELDL